MKSPQINFTGRCPEIKTAYKVCHIINEQLPHISSTKVSPMFEKMKWNFIDSYDKFLNQNPLFPLSCSSPAEKKFFNLMLCQKELVRRMNNVRDCFSTKCKTDFERINNTISQLKFAGLGNCMENADVSAAVMKINGFNNVYTAHLKRGDEKIDHMICLFNKDGSPFNGKWNKNTIILDSWAGICDFAGNMFKKYENMFKDYFYIPRDGKFGFNHVKSLKFSENELTQLKETYPELLFLK